MSIEIDDVDDQEDLKQILQVLNTRLDALTDGLDGLEARVGDIESRLDDVERDVSTTQAAVPEQSKTKMDNVVEVVKHAYNKETRGRAGTTLPSGEVTAVIDGSKQTGLRLMDEIGGKFDFAHVENPGGPNPKQLKIKTQRDLPERLDKVVDRYKQ